MTVLRNLAFYPLFYLGSAFYVISCLIAIPFSTRMLRRSVRGWGRYHRWCVTRLLGIRIVETGAARPEGPLLYAIRHESFFEAIDCPAQFSYPAVFAKQELFSIPGWGRAAERYGLVPVAREQGARTLRKMIAAAKERAAAGRELVIFPEGTRVPHGERRELQSGFAGLYKLIGLPVVPVAVNSGPLYHRRLKRKGTITYQFGEPIPPGLPRDEVEQRVLDAINALNGQSAG